MTPLPAATNSICVVIAAYNASAYIARAVGSALRQREVNEVIVVDDASHDATVAIARGCDDGSGRLQVLVMETNGGPSAARNRALEVCRSEWMAILDADDFFIDGRFAALLSHAGEADLLADNMYQVPMDAIDRRDRQLLPVFAQPLAVSFETFVRANISQKGAVRMELGFLKPMIRTQFLHEHGITYQEQMRLGEDFELYARALAQGARMLVIPTPGYVSVMRGDSLSARHSTHDLMALRDSSAALMNIPMLQQTERRALRAHYLGMDCRAQWRRLIDCVKARDIGGAASCFMRPWPVPFYLMRQLAGEAIARVTR